jgi:hypothetical protein
MIINSTTGTVSPAVIANCEFQTVSVNIGARIVVIVVLVYFPYQGIALNVSIVQVSDKNSLTASSFMSLS